VQAEHGSTSTSVHVMPSPSNPSLQVQLTIPYESTSQDAFELHTEHGFGFGAEHASYRTFITVTSAEVPSAHRMESCLTFFIITPLAEATIRSPGTVYRVGEVQ
jgi:hypothetical protein